MKNKNLIMALLAVIAFFLNRCKKETIDSNGSEI
jgi:hypothetical protein